MIDFRAFGGDHLVVSVLSILIAVFVFYRTYLVPLVERAKKKAFEEGKQEERLEGLGRKVDEISKEVKRSKREIWNALSAIAAKVGCALPPLKTDDE